MCLCVWPGVGEAEVLSVLASGDGTSAHPEIRRRELLCLTCAVCYCVSAHPSLLQSLQSSFCLNCSTAVSTVLFLFKPLCCSHCSPLCVWTALLQSLQSSLCLNCTAAVRTVLLMFELHCCSDHRPLCVWIALLQWPQSSKSELLCCGQHSPLCLNCCGQHSDSPVCVLTAEWCYGHDDDLSSWWWL